MREWWKGEFPSESGGTFKDGRPKIYTVRLYDNGTYACTCSDYIIRSVNDGKPERRCKHIAKAIAQRPEWQDVIKGVPVAPPSFAPRDQPKPQQGIGGLSLDDIEPTARRRR